MYKFLRGIKENIKTEKLIITLKKNFKVLTATITLIVIITGIIIYSNYNYQKQNKNSSRIYAQANMLAQKGKINRAIKIARNLNKETNNYSNLSYLLESHILQSAKYIKNLEKKTNTVYNLLLKKKNLEKSMQEFINLLQSWNQLDNKIDKRIIKKLNFNIHTESIWKPLLLEILGIHSLKTYKHEKAKEFFKKTLKNNLSNQAIKARISAMLSMIPIN